MQVGARLRLDAVPLLDGALDCARQGIFSSIYMDNARAAVHVSNFSIASSHSAWPLLFDPQTGVRKHISWFLLQIQWLFVCL